MARCTGIQILENRVRAVTLSGSPKNPRVTRFAEIPRTPEEEGEKGWGGTVRRLLQENRIPKDPAVLALPTTDVKVRTLAIPFQSPDQIRKVIRTMMEEHLHGFPIEEALLTFHKLRDLDNLSSHVLALAIHQKTLGERLTDLQAHGVDPQAVDVDLSALYNFCRFAKVLPDEGTSVVIDLEADRVAMVAVKDGVLQAIRAFRVNLPQGEKEPEEDPSQETEGEGEEPPPEAKAAPEGEEPVPPPPEEIPQAVVEKLAREILRTLMAEGIEEEPAVAYVCGRLSEREGLMTGLAEKTGLPLAPLPMPPALEGLPPWAVIGAGAGLKLMGHDALQFDFRQEGLVFKRKFERVKVGLTVLSVLAFILFALLGSYFKQLHRKEFNTHMALAENSLKIYRRALHLQKLEKGYTVRDAIPEILRELKTKYNDLTGRGVDKDVPQIASVLSLWRDLALRIQSVRKDIPYLTVKDISLSSDFFILKGDVDSPESLDALLNVIVADPRFSKVVYGAPPKQTKEDKLRFHLQGKMQLKSPERKK
ncbi:MAG: hypothetical protein ACYTHM_04350 [Planctomycetota bacterium]